MSIVCNAIVFFWQCCDCVYNDLSLHSSVSIVSQRLLGLRAWPCALQRTPVWREITSNSVCVCVCVCVWCVCVLMWPHAQAAERSVVYCSLGAGIISELFSRFLKWPERLGVLQTQKVLMAKTWSFSGGCLIISQLSSNCSNPIKTHATAANQIIRGLNLHNWSPALSSSVSAAFSFCPSLPSSHSHFRLAFLICLSFYSPNFPFHSSFLLPFFWPSLLYYFLLPPFLFLSSFFFLSFFLSFFLLLSFVLSSLLSFLLVLLFSTFFPSCICSCLSFVFLFPTVQIFQNTQICNQSLEILQQHFSSRLIPRLDYQIYSFYSVIFIMYNNNCLICFFIF